MKTCYVLILIYLSLGSSWSSEAPPLIPHGGGLSYYLAADGNDLATGTSPEKSWRSIDRLNQAPVTAGDTVYFHCGDIFRGQLKPASGQADLAVRYTAYGSGDKPILTASIDCSASTDWQQGAHGLWRYQGALNYDIAALYFNDLELIGRKRWSVQDCTQAGDFFSDPNTHQLWLYAENKPSSIWSRIEAAETRHIVDQNHVSYVIFDGLHLHKGGAHGFGGANSAHMLIRSCDFSYIGGGFLHMNQGKPVRYGNAIEFWGNAAHHLVENNRIWEIYDTALTNQNHTRVASQHHIYYRNNSIWNCGLASFEVWNRPAASRSSHIYILNNTSRNPGHGWGAQHRPDHNNFHFASYSNQAQSDNIVIQGNTFFSTLSSPAPWHRLLFYSETSLSPYTISGNSFIQPEPLFFVEGGISKTVEAFQQAHGLDSNTGFPPSAGDLERPR